MSKCGDGIAFQLFLACSMGPLDSTLNGIKNLSFPSYHLPGQSRYVVLLQKVSSCLFYGYIFCMVKRVLLWLMLEQWLFSVLLPSRPMVTVILGPSPTPALWLLLFFPCIAGPCLFGISRKCHHVVFPVPSEWILLWGRWFSALDRRHRQERPMNPWGYVARDLQPC